ncbi:UDP-glycosyltransferase 73C6-like [Arachis stenosperma]|uniref:UDP-glycosyltransferase 73C6-like n=1 Tax=Arachis stenosperma TaxID=217475 RepID=UPI0025AB938A|nr:UDP-glycosyltransferase 73C6-like [Arachis stenosperma]
MAFQTPQLHFVVFPFMAQGHMIPMMDIAKLLLQRNNVIVTVITTTQNAARFTSTFARFIDSGYQIRLIQLQFPYKEAGLPEGCENLDMLHSLGNALSLFNALNLLREPVEKIFEELSPPPSCIVSDMSLPYTIHIAKKFNIPRISFVGVSCYCLMCYEALRTSNVKESIKDETEYFVIPGLPDEIEVTKAQVPGPADDSWNKFYQEIHAAEADTYGIIMNSFQELEPEYERMYKKVRKDKVWCVGPVSLSNKDQLEKAQRGNKVSTEEWMHQKWLDSQKSKSVIYVCLGSLCNLTATQLIEIGLALEESKRPFIWVIREGSQLKRLEKWIKEDGFEERIKDESLIIRGWAPQLLILSHPSIGGFLTHCGWNSNLEAICAGVPMLTWPLFADQFLNEKLVVKVLKVGVKVGAESSMVWGKEEEIGVLVKKEDIKIGIEKLMDENDADCEERRERVRQLAEMAKRSVEEGGSSHSNLTMFIQDILHNQIVKS